MIEIGGLALLRPVWILGVPAALLAGWLIARRVAALAGWDRAIDPALVHALHRIHRVVPGSGRVSVLPTIAAVLIAVALTGPAIRRADGTAFRNLDGVVLVIDLSRSVATGGRFTEALTAARLVADRAGSRPVALVVFAGDAYLASTFTTDADALGTTIAVLDGETVPDPGSRPERGLALARQTLGEAGTVAGDVVLVADGGGIGPGAIREAGSIVAAGGRVSALYVPAVAADGPARGDRGLLYALARAGGGQSATVLDPGPVADMIGGRTATRIADNGYSVLVWSDYGRGLLMLALAPALFLFRRRA